MDANVDIPAQPDIPNGIVEFRFRPGQKDVGAIINRDGKQYKIGFNIQDTLDAMSSTNKGVVKTWYKNFAVLAINALNQSLGATPITDTDINGEAFDDV